MPKYAIIGGSGVYDPDILNNLSNKVVNTPYGSINVNIGSQNGNEIAFLPRHGESHSVPPHQINFRANIWGLKELGVERILTTSASGSMNKKMEPGDFVLLDQFLDFTANRKKTFYDGEESPHNKDYVAHVDFTEPYCNETGKAVLETADEKGYTIHDGGTYVCADGPRFETKAEIQMFNQLGGDLVGMTQVPEVILARELEMCYAGIGIVTNSAAGIQDNITHEEVVDVMDKIIPKVKELLVDSVDKVPVERDCRCADALEGAK